MTCTFFGHRNTPETIKPLLRSTIINLIEEHNVNLFYVGNNGQFDNMTYSILKELSEQYSFRYFVVFAYMPIKQNSLSDIDATHTLFPEEIETAPKRFAIDYRNKWMIEQSDYVVTYITDTIGSGAAKFKEVAKKQNKTVMEL